MKISEAPVGYIITIGHPANEMLAVKMHDEQWRWVDSGRTCRQHRDQEHDK